MARGEVRGIEEENMDILLQLKKGMVLSITIGKKADWFEHDHDYWFQVGLLVFNRQHNPAYGRVLCKW